MNLYYVSGVVMTPHPQDCDCLSCLLAMDDPPPMDAKAVWFLIEANDPAAAADTALDRANDGPTYKPGMCWDTDDPHIEEFGQDRLMVRLPAHVAPTLPGFESIREAAR